MLKALLWKQKMELKNVYLGGRKRKNANVSQKRGTGFIVLFAFIYFLMLGSFFAIAAGVGSGLLVSGLDWIYFLIMTVIAFLVGLVGGVLSTYTILFKATDNEFLLAMPIPPIKILTARMVSVYVMGLIYESMVLIPTIIFYFIVGHPSVLAIIFCILGLFILGFLIMVFSCLFGWVIALIASKLKNQKILTVIISVLFIAAFMYLRFAASSIIRSLMEHAAAIGDAIKGWGYPIYALGLGMSGDVVGFLVFTAITAVLFALTCFLMSKSFLKIVATKNESVSKTFSDSQIRTGNTKSALRRKEFKHFTGSPTYMVNCGLGVLFLVAGAVFLLIKIQDVRVLINSLLWTNPLLYQVLPVAGAFAICLLASFCDIAAPAISVEGKGIWVLQTLPVDPYDVLKAKLFVHVSITGIPAVICAIVVGIVLQGNVFTYITIILCAAVFVIFSGSAMLALDLKRPMLDWTNEAQPIKQSINVVISMFGGMILAAIFAALYLLLGRFLGAEIYLLICTVLMAVFTVLIHKWFRTKGRVIFATL